MNTNNYWHIYIIFNIVALVFLGVIEIFAYDTGQLGIFGMIHKSDKWYWAYIFWFILMCPMLSAFLYGIINRSKINEHIN